MKIKNKIDRNTLALRDLLEAMTLYHYEKEIEDRLNNFIRFLDDLIFTHYNGHDIIDEEYFCITTFED